MGNLRSGHAKPASSDAIQRKITRFPLRTASGTALLHGFHAEIIIMVAVARSMHAQLIHDIHHVFASRDS